MQDLPLPVRRVFGLIAVTVAVFFWLLFAPVLGLQDVGRWSVSGLLASWAVFGQILIGGIWQTAGGERLAWHWQWRFTALSTVTCLFGLALALYGGEIGLRAPWIIGAAGLPLSVILPALRRAARLGQ